MSTPSADASPSTTEMDICRWDATITPEERAAAIATVESGGLLVLPRLAFVVESTERRFLSAHWADVRSKNISLDPRTENLSGARGTAEDLEALGRMILRFADGARGLIASLFPTYAPAVVVARTSFRPVEIAGRETTWRKDDRRLHVDAFPSRPNHGARILRVFSNANPDGAPRVWRIGEPFEDVAARFLPRVRPPLPGAARALAALRITKSVRSRYDHVMLSIHDLMKSDAAYQREARSHEVAFPAGSSWICFSDQVSHAVMRGQYLLEQTLDLPLSAMHDSRAAPLRVLERLTGRALA